MYTDKQMSTLKMMDRLAYLLSAIVLFLVIVTRQEVKPDFGINFGFLPAVYSTLNALTALMLIAAFIQIKKKNINAHKNLIYASIASSILFLLCYVLYHFTTPETKYCGTNQAVRYFYFVLLITHIILAGVIMPFILMTFNRAYLNMIDKHRKMAKWVFPFWLYVAITGPIIFLMLQPCYNH